MGIKTVEAIIHIPEFGITEKKSYFSHDADKIPFKLEKLTLKSGKSQLWTNDVKPGVVTFISDTPFIDYEEFCRIDCEHCIQCEVLLPHYRFTSGVYVEIPPSPYIIKLSGYRGVKVTLPDSYKRYELLCEFSNVSFSSPSRSNDNSDGVEGAT